MTTLAALVVRRVGDFHHGGTEIRDHGEDLENSSQSLRGLSVSVVKKRASSINSNDKRRDYFLSSFESSIVDVMVGLVVTDFTRRSWSIQLSVVIFWPPASVTVL